MFKQFFCFTVLIISLIGLCSNSLANLSQIKIVTAPEVKYMRDNEDVLLVHTLSRIEYEIHHIPGSIHIASTDVKSSKKMPKDKKKAIVFYCNGVKCPYSKRASDAAIKMGYQNIFWFKGGIPEWIRFHYKMNNNKMLKKVKIKKLRPSKFQAKMNKDRPFMLDVRPIKWNIEPAYIENSVFIPLLHLHEKFQSIPKTRKILIADGFMKQSSAAAKFLTYKGYDVLGVLKGGIVRWKKEGYPVVVPK
ncbi:MAG: hypothetical protein HON94_04035 [Methylococcales bacterium]|jgi:rhodanese-related sulfurtransferase|nr:hypothetical protein [Methylococcales bacterium]MBT7409446.1 hypothetical protein [Methylococcales bacterium]